LVENLKLAEKMMAELEAKVAEADANAAAAAGAGDALAAGALADVAIRLEALAGAVEDKAAG